MPGLPPAPFGPASLPPPAQLGPPAIAPSLGLPPLGSTGSTRPLSAMPPALPGPRAPSIPSPQAPSFGSGTPQGNPLGGMIQSGLVQGVGMNIGYGLGNTLASGLQPQARSAGTGAAGSAPAAPSVPRDYSGTDWRAAAADAASKNGVPASIFGAQIQQESGFDPAARSPAGAIGIAQIMPGTASDWGVDPTDPQASLDMAAKMMRRYHDQLGSWPAAAVAYNAGYGFAQQWLAGQRDLSPETLAYLKALGLSD